MNRELLNQRISVKPVLTKHQSVRQSTRSLTNPYKSCVMCLNYVKNIYCTTCIECMGTEDLDNFKFARYIEDDPKWAWLVRSINGSN